MFFNKILECDSGNFCPGQVLILDKITWPTISFPVDPKRYSVGLRSRLCRTLKVLHTKPCVYGASLIHGVSRTEKDLPQTVVTKLEEHNCPKCLCMM